MEPAVIDAQVHERFARGGEDVVELRTPAERHVARELDAHERHRRQRDAPEEARDLVDRGVVREIEAALDPERAGDRNLLDAWHGAGRVDLHDKDVPRSLFLEPRRFGGTRVPDAWIEAERAVPVAEREVIVPLGEDRAPIDQVLGLQPVGEVDEGAVGDGDEDGVGRLAPRERARRVVAVVPLSKRAGVEARVREHERSVVEERVNVIACAKPAERAVGGGRVVVPREQQNGDGGERLHGIARSLERVLADGVVVQDVAGDDDGVHVARFGDARDPFDDLEALEARDCARVAGHERELEPELPVCRVEEAKPLGHAATALALRGRPRSSDP